MNKLLRHVSLIDVVNRGVREHVSISITGDTITEIASDEGVSASSHHEVIEGEDTFVVPGLIDLHTHLTWDGKEDPVRTAAEEGIQVSLFRAAANARATVEAGITTIRDLGSYENGAIAVAKAIERGFVTGPRVIASGCSIIMTGGHDQFWGIQVDGEVEALRTVRKQVLAGAKVIKVSATGGVYGRTEGEEIGTAELTEGELKVICSEAHRFGLKVAAHAISETGIENCIRAGVDTIEHGHFLTERQMGMLIKKGIYWIPTLFVYRQIAHGENIPPYAMEKAKQIVTVHRDTFKRGVAKGILMAPGSDAGSPNTPHPSLVMELECMAEYGAKPMEVLRSATLNAAHALGMNAAIGSLEVRKKADLVVVKKNPLDDISNLREVLMVMKGGKVVVRNNQTQ